MLIRAGSQVSSDTRVDFEFRGAGLKTPKRSFSLPPFGKGWFENVYIDGAGSAEVATVPPFSPARTRDRFLMCLCHGRRLPSQRTCGYLGIPAETR